MNLLNWYSRRSYYIISNRYNLEIRATPDCRSYAIFHGNSEIFHEESGLVDAGTYDRYTDLISETSRGIKKSVNMADYGVFIMVFLDEPSAHKAMVVLISLLIKREALVQADRTFLERRNP